MEERTVAFVDLAGFTTMTVAHGDEVAADLAGRFTGLVRDELEGDDQLVKSIGDAVMLASPRPIDGLRLIGRICGRADAEPAFPVLRVGLHHGPVVRRGDDWFGTTVNLAARLAAQAGGGQVLATATVAEDARAAGMAVRPVGLVALRGLPDRMQLFEVEPCPADPQRSIDPVCRMAVLDGSEVGRLMHEGVEYRFCSLACAGAFTRDPSRFALHNKG